MALHFLLTSLFLGAGGGILYGCSFLGQRSFLIRPLGSLSRRFFFAFFSLASFVRFVLLAVLFFYVLRSPSLDIILVLVSFFGGFWLIVLQKKVRSHEH